MVTFPRCFQQTLGTEIPLHPGTAPAGCPPSSRPVPSSVCSVSFPHASLPKTNSARLPTQIFGIPGQPYICLCFGQEHVLNCLLQRCRREGRWLNLPFSTGLNPACNKTRSKGAVSQPPLCVCVCGVWEGICGEMAIFPQISCWRGATIRTGTPAAQFICELCVGKRFNS